MQGRPIRLAVIDTDSGFVRVLTKRLEATSSHYRILPSTVLPEDLVGMRVNALVVDPSVLGPRAWEFLECVGEAMPELGLIVCTERSTVAERVRGLRLGADDWIAKPCHPEEVIARVEAVVRRRGPAPNDSDPPIAGELEIQAARFQAFVDGRNLDLTRREFELLRLLADCHGRVLPREDVYQLVWGYAMAHGDRSVDVFVRKLRLKLKAASPAWTYIHTHFGIGYRFEPEHLDDESPDAAPADVELAPPSPA